MVMGKLVNIAGGAITLFLGLILWILFSVIGGIKAGLGHFDPTLYAAMVTSFFLMILGPILFWIVLPLIGWYRHRRKLMWPIQPPASHSVYYCTNCGRPLKYLPQYQKWFCENCKTYPPTREEILQRASKALDEGNIELAKRLMEQARQ